MQKRWFPTDGVGRVGRCPGKQEQFQYTRLSVYLVINEPRHEKTCLPGLRPGLTQDG